jgi:uncharacterized protein involved in outer membrane biogenesis
MIRKIAAGALLLFALATTAGALWVRSVFTHDNVRRALAEQIAAAIGQPVAIETISASIYPRVTVRLGGVRIGQPARIEAKTLRLGTDLRALLSRQIVHGAVHLDGARVELPLPPLGSSKPSTTTATDGGSSVEIVSIDEIVLNGVEIVSGGRTLRGDIVVAPHGEGATLRSIALTADGLSISGSGEIRRLAGPVGEIALQAESLDFARLLDFLTVFAGGSGFTGGASTRESAPTAPVASATPIDLTLALNVARAAMGTLTLDGVRGRARVTPQAVAFEPIEFGAFGGRYAGALTIAADATPTFRLRADVSGVDMAALTTYAGSPNVISGRMSGRVDLSGPTSAAAGLMNTAHGTARVDIRDGVVRKLGLVRTVVIATSMRADAQLPADASTDEPFSRLGGTLTLANGIARTDDLEFESPSVRMLTAGSLRLDGSTLDLRGRLQLSEALSQQAGRDLLRYTQDEGRVTLPAIVSGSAQAPSVQVDVAGLATRALQNRAKEEIKKRLGSLFRRE